jgi:hypothetical protein
VGQFRGFGDPSLLCSVSLVAKQSVFVRYGIFPSFASLMAWVCGAVCEIGGNGMGQINPRLIFDFIKQQYRPYDTHEEFDRGFSAYQSGSFDNPHTADSISALAWDLGAEAAMRYQRVIAG